MKYKYAFYVWSMHSMYVQFGQQRHSNWWIIGVLTQNPAVLMFVAVKDAPTL